MSKYAVRNPATGQVVETFPSATDEEVAAAVASAASAYAEWGRTSTVAERAALVRRVAELHRERAGELAKAINEEMGKALGAAEGEVLFSADIYQYYSDRAEQFLADQEIELLGGSGRALLRRQPVGALLGIMPWNYPVYQVARFAAPNLVTGNTIVLKHAAQCPRSAALQAAIFRDAGLPEGAFVNVYATNDQIADVIADPRIQGVSLTGSERAGSIVGEIAGRHLKKCVLELGGADPFVLLSTDDLDAAVDDALSARTGNVGQACNGAKRFVVVDELYDDFVAALHQRVSAAAVAAPLSSLAAAEGLAAQVDAAVAAGAHLVASGERDGAFHPVGVLTDVAPDNPAYHQEFFGPVAMVFRASDEADAIRIANDTPYGLGSYVYTTDPEQADRVASALEVGMVFVNGVGLEAVELPFGGVRLSGYGRELGSLGIEEFVNKKMIRIA
ncbi:MULTISPECIES: aldehyde dehydrogenase family protein [unclassified Nocardioides]|uniref:aldehyde dehydrogenase family protein n=1 Tax=unclassified Nocardioides TaxID=2615069 RepID=UPI0007038F2A|nr:MULTISPECIES: aldehyde dehydrogenase family protein [unclassified Nocardioides]KRC52604.1 succinate-semialdehyde dehydrogenase [Nocardioides sp. Root79]KRC72136.1 succinate-semialdehyde dehydrogenase [Nocardioides sp. Root240]